jgi:hypothetical protein
MRDMTEPYETYDDQSDYDWDYDAPEDRGPRPRVLWGRVISLVVFVLIAFFLGRLSVSDDGITQNDLGALESENTTLETQNDELLQENRQLQTAIDNLETGETDTEGETEEDPGTEGEASEQPTETVVVQPGDALSAIVDDAYGCTIAVDAEGNETDLVDFVADAQEAGFERNRLAAGQDIIIPAIPEGYACP